MAETLQIDDVTVRFENMPILKNAALRLAPGERAAIVGPNGAGKTTLIRCAAGLLEPSEGAVRLGSIPLRRLSGAERARRIAYLPQIRPLAWPLKVRDAVALGRYAYGAGAGRMSAVDRQTVDEALRLCGLALLANRDVDTLSGGELARMHFARAWCGRADYLLADEPTAALDPDGQLAILDLLERAAAARVGVLAVLHDLNFAGRFADTLIWMQEGFIVAAGPPRETLTRERIAKVFGVKAQVTWKDERPSVSLDRRLADAP